jgi:hypothetical protein
LKFLADENGIGKQITRAKHVLSPSATLRINSVEGTQSTPMNEKQKKLETRKLEVMVRSCNATADCHAVVQMS